MVDHDQVLQSLDSKTEDIIMEEKYLERRAHKILLILLKVIPMILALSAMTGTMLDFFCIDSSILSFLCGVSLVPLIFLYISSYVFRFCEYHRMFLHYIVVNNALVYWDYFIGVPVSTRGLFKIHIFVIGLFLFLILYFYKKERCCRQ